MRKRVIQLKIVRYIQWLRILTVRMLDLPGASVLPDMKFIRNVHMSLVALPVLAPATQKFLNDHDSLL